MGLSRGFMPFNMSTKPKVNVIARLKFELVSYVFTVLHVSHYATGDSLFWEMAEYK